MANATPLPRREDVERIVRDVLAQILAAGPRSETNSAANGQRVVSAKVVSVAELGEGLESVSQLIVPRGAVFTPAARDELRKHQIAVASDVGSQGPAKARHVVVGKSEVA